MNEDLLHFIWKFKLLKPVPLFTIDKKPFSIVRTGDYNTHAGPDFTNARVRFGDTEWAGNVEIHKRASDWFLHNHQRDAAYDNVILHIVYEHDREIVNSKDRAIPCFELKDFIEEDLLQRYEHLYSNKQHIPCGKAFSSVPPIIREPWLERMLIERLESKTGFIHELFTFNSNNWEDTFYLLLCKNLGFKVNAEPFLQLGRSVPLHTLLKERGSPMKLEALLFGQSGLLKEDASDEYAVRLYKEYVYLRKKHDLPPPIPHTWKFLRMRPLNFPTVRIAQLAGFIANYQHVFSKILEATSLKAVSELFHTTPSSYWDTHYVFGGESPALKKKLGNSSIENIFINTICPLLFYYGKARQEASLCEKALDWYQELKPEDNEVTRLFEVNGFQAENAGQTQGLLQLETNYCSAKKCLQCGVGTHLLKAADPIAIGFTSEKINVK